MDDKVINKIEKVGDTYIFETYEKPLRTQIEELKNELDKKDKEISKLKNELLQPQSEIINSKEDVIDAMQSLNLLQKQKAIEELEKVKSRLRYFYHDPKKCLNKDDAIEDFKELIDERIKELEGE